MTFSEFCKELNVTEAEAHELVHHLAAFRMRATKKAMPSDKMFDQMLADMKRNLEQANGL